MTLKPLETTMAGVLGLLLMLLSSNARVAEGSETHLINNPRGLIKLSNEVSAGDLHAGVTVFLDADIDFSDLEGELIYGESESFEPIGNSWKKYFRGTFDGHGHVIRNLDINSTSQFAGLFGYSGGLTVRNVILDDTCAISNGLDSLYESYTGGVIGYCSAQDGPCTVENCVNMAHVAFTGYVKSAAILGGIVATIDAQRYDTAVTNCANYGDVTHDGGSGFSYIGGIIGGCMSTTAHVYVHNCLNYGALVYEEESSMLYTRIGGIVGRSESSITLVNTVHAGRIRAENQAGDKVGAIMGNFENKATVTMLHCLWTDPALELAVNNSEVKAKNTSLAALDKDTVAGLNSYPRNASWSRWVLNKGRRPVTATVAWETTFTMAYEVFLLPDVLGTDRYRFSGWFTDANYTTPFTGDEVPSGEAGALTLYSGWSYTLSFESNGGAAIEPKTVICGSVVELPALGRKKEGGDCVFERWDDAFDDEAPREYVVPNFNVTLYAVWLCANLSTPQDLVDFSKIVRGGKNYSGTTVTLANDLAFDAEHSRKFLPIGDESTEDAYNTFAGTFDGRGYVIDGLRIRTSSHYTGLFGIVRGATIRNVVMGPSYSVQSTYVAFPDVGGIVGRANGNRSDVAIENCVNMGDITYAENTGSFLFIGGIVGLITRTGDATVLVRNCANYGTITFAGKEATRIFVGGIAGEAEGGADNKDIQNCANYGAFVNNGAKMGRNIVGGILGAVWDTPTSVLNCLSAAPLGRSASEGAQENIGTVAGYLNHRANIVNCLWTAGVGPYNMTGYFGPGDLSSYGSELVPLGQGAADRLNKNAEESGSGLLNTWFMLHLNGGRIGSVESDALVVVHRHFPAPVKEGHTFRCWCLDAPACANRYDPRASQVTKNTHVSAAWDVNSYRVSFETHGSATLSDVVAAFNTTVRMPSVAKKDCTLMWWEDDRGNAVMRELRMPARNITLHAVWYCTRIASSDDLVGLSRVVNRGAAIVSDTVVLDKDIVVAQSSAYAFEPIGADEAHYFNGTFDGQGFTITITAEVAAKYAGLFGYLRGALVNVVLSDSAFTSYYSGPGDAYLGGLAARCDACAIRNSLSKGAVTFAGGNDNGSGTLYLGGLAGWASNNKTTFDNCANYGSVVYAGANAVCMVGGLVGYFAGSPQGTYLQNSLSYALISVAEREDGAAEMHIGGLVGRAAGVSLVGCASAGKITTTTGRAESLVGSANAAAATTITRCYWTGDVGYGNTHKAAAESHPIGLNSTGVATLNAAGKGARWLLNPNGRKVTFRMGSRAFVLSAPLILFPDAASIINSKERKFKHWEKDSVKFTADTVHEDTALDAKITSRAIETMTFVGLGVIIFAVISLIIIITILVHHYIYRTHKKRKEIKMYVEPLLYDNATGSLDGMDHIYPSRYKKVPLEKALTNAGVEAKVARDVVEDCYARTRANMKETNLPHGISTDNAAAICLYTMETDKMEKNPYAIINEALMDGSVEAVRPVKDFLYLVMTSLRKLPIFYGKPLYRGIRMNVINKGKSENSHNSPSSSSSSSSSSTAAVISLTNSFMFDGVRDEKSSTELEEDYTEGEEITWRALSSTSPNVAVTKAFLAKGTTSGKAEGTLFIIENGWGYNVQSCSMFPREAEIVLEPERRFRVKTVIPGEGLTIIKIEMLKTPIVLTDVFGEINFNKLV